MTIYTVMGTNEHTEWIAKSFTCEQTATNFLNDCIRITRTASSIYGLLEFSPDPTIRNNDSVKRNLTSNRIHYTFRIRYTLHINELVTDAFMELTLQPHKPKSKFKDFLWA